MGPFEMVVAIVLIVAIAGVMKARASSGVNAETNDQIVRLKAQVDQLNERVKVLEKLATDPAKRLSDEIERLRG
ncbi:MAG TPA: hypothetical protein VIG90_01350 [Pedomonas sp.]|uniref:hypothetical protein n=1 Tax=Pedomonas sp. TaxID=2976421 RepID=UPI002F400B0A